jgi:hypothetical protein
MLNGGVLPQRLWNAHLFSSTTSIGALCSVPPAEMGRGAYGEAALLGYPLGHHFGVGQVFHRADWIPGGGAPLGGRL